MMSNKLKRPNKDRDRVQFSTRNLYKDLLDRMRIIADAKGASVEYVLNIAVKKGLDVWEPQLWSKGK